MELYDNAYKVESLYISKFSALGATEDQALELYGLEIQESQSWRFIAKQFLGPVERFRERLAFEEYIESNLENPIGYWIELLIPLFEEAYQAPQNYDAINRIYAYADWCHVQEKSVDSGSYDLPTVVMCGFYESIPTFPGALIDMPSWFNIDELRGWLLDSPFMEDSRPDMLRAFGVAE